MSTCLRDYWGYYLFCRILGWLSNLGRSMMCYRRFRFIGRLIPACSNVLSWICLIGQHLVLLSTGSLSASFVRCLLAFVFILIVSYFLQIRIAIWLRRLLICRVIFRSLMQTRSSGLSASLNCIIKGTLVNILNWFRCIKENISRSQFLLISYYWFL